MKKLNLAKAAKLIGKNAGVCKTLLTGPLGPVIDVAAEIAIEILIDKVTDKINVKG